MNRLRRFLRPSSDRAVSPVIAVILMVAITVVLAATVYVWVSGFGSSSTQPANTISLTKQKVGYYQAFTVASATPGLTWSDLTFQVDGMDAYDIILADGGSGARSTAFTPSLASAITAGDTLYIVNADTDAATATLRILDTQANAVILTMTGISMDAGSGADATTAGTSVTRLSGAGAYAAGNELRITFNAPIQPDTLAIGGMVLNAGSFGTGATVAMTSPTTAVVTLGTAPTVASGATITMADIEDLHSNAIADVVATVP